MTSKKYDIASRQVVEDFLDPIISIGTIANYYRRFIGAGDFYSLNLAKKQVESKFKQKRKISELKSILDLVSEKRSIKAAGEAYAVIMLG